MAPIDRTVCELEEPQGGTRVVAGEGASREARQIVGFFLRQINPLRGHRHQVAQHRPETFEVSPFEERVDRLHATDECLADVLRHVPSMGSLRLPVCGAERATLLNATVYRGLPLTLQTQNK